MNTVIYDYKGSQISFSNGENVMINATEMAKFFGKRPVDWLQNQQTEDFLNELSKVRKSTLTDLVQVTKGGNNPGTWMHEDVAMEFARWLSPSFAIWCNDHIKELLRTGVTTVSNDDETILHAMTVLQQRVEENKRKLAEVSAEKVQLQLTTAAQQQELKAQAPEKKIAKLLGGLNVISIFAVRQFFISNDTGIFYAQKGTILKNIGKLYPNFIWLVSIKDCRRLGYFLPFLYLTNKFV